MNKAVFCIAQNIEQAEFIVDRLKTAGFSYSRYTRGKATAIS